MKTQDNFINAHALHATPQQQRKGGNFSSKTIIKTIRCILISVRNTKLLLLQHNMNNLVYERQFPLPSNDT